MSEGNIRINKVLRELNISLERAVDYLKDKGIAIEASPNTKISDDVYNILCGQFKSRGRRRESFPSELTSHRRRSRSPCRN